MKNNPRFDKMEEYIGPGEFFSSKEDIVISTLLGSCISVALYDLSVPVGGLNHFMLPFPKSETTVLFSAPAKYGINAMEVLINEILKSGGTKRKLQAKVFGGSTMMIHEKESANNIARMNIQFVFEFLEAEHIPVEAYSVGGTTPRRIYFFPRTGKVLMRYSKSSFTSLVKREISYSHELLENSHNSGKPVFF